MKKRILRRKLFFGSKKVKKGKKYKYKYIKDEGTINFILQHTQKPEIDFSKIKIPSFLEDFSKDEDSFNNSFLKDISLPILKFTVFPDTKNEEEKEEKENQSNSFFNSFIFKKTN